MAIEEFSDSISIYPGDVSSPSTITWEERVGQARGTCDTASQRTRISVPRFPKPSRNNPRGRHVRRRVCVARIRRGLVRLTYDKFNALLHAAMPSFLADTYGLGPHTAGYYYFHSFPHVCLSVCPSVCPYIRSSFPRLSPLSGRAPSPVPRESLFGCFRGLPLKRASSLPHTRETGLLVFCARHVTESPRGRLCCRDVISPAPRPAGFLSTSFARTKKWNTCIAIMLWRASWRYAEKLVRKVLIR